MILCIIAVVVLYLINPVLGWIGVPVCVGLYALTHLPSKDKKQSGDNKDDRNCDAPFTEYDEFDWWQDNQ